jgi:phosphonate transport system permease protein
VTTRPPETTRAAARPKSGRPQPPSHRVRNLLTALVLLVVVGNLLAIDIRWDRLPDLPGRLLTTARLMFLPPDWSYADRAWAGMVESIQIAWVGTLIGAAISLPLGFLAAHNVSGKAGFTLVRQILNAIRAIPELLWALVFFIPMVGLGPFAGALALGVNSTGTLGKLTSEVVEGIDQGPVEAARASGASRVQMLRWGVLPQVLPEVVAFWLYRFEINLRASAILGLVGAGGVGAVLAQTLQYRRWALAGMTVIVVVVATIVIDALSAAARRRIIRGSERTVTTEPAEASG